MIGKCQVASKLISCHKNLWECFMAALFVQMQHCVVVQLQQSHYEVQGKVSLKTKNIEDVTLLVMFIFSAQKLEHLLQEFRSLQDTLAEVCQI